MYVQYSVQWSNSRVLDETLSLSLRNLYLEAFNGTDELKYTKENIEDEIMKDETDENQVVDDKPPSIPCHVTRR